MWRYTYNLRSLYETPVFADDDRQPDRDKVKAIIDRVRAEGRTILTEAESKAVIGAYNIPITPMEITDNPDEAVALAEKMGYPVVLKLNSETITHKMDVGGVQLNLQNADDVRAAFELIRKNVTERRGAEHFQGVSVQPMITNKDGYELIIGSSIDPQFGPVLLFGAGGTLVEIFKDSALGLPPLTTTLARRMMEGTKIYEALHGIRGRKPVDLDALEKLMVRFSQMIVEQPWIAECDINPLVVSADQIIALDGRVVLHPPTTREEDLPQPAIRPYPTQYVHPFISDEGVEFLIRPIRPEDEPRMVAFHETLSERTVQLRYFAPLSLRQRTDHERLTRVVFNDYAREIALVAERTNPRTGEKIIAAVGRMAKSIDGLSAEFGLIVSDRYQGQGLGREIMHRLLEVARAEGVAELRGLVAPENTSMLNILRDMGFSMEEADNVILARRAVLSEA
jgi:acetyltransferase